MFARIACCFDLAFESTLPKTAGHQDALHLTEQLVGIFGGELFAINQMHFHIGALCDACMMKCLDDRKVSIRQAHIFAYDRDICRVFAGSARVEEHLERREVDRSNGQVEFLEHLHIEVLRGEHDGHLID